MSLIEPSNTMGPDPAAPADPNHTYADTEAGGGGQTITPPTPQDVVVPPVAGEETEQDTFDRKYVEELRRENAKWRTRAHEYEETFSPLDESLRQGWLELINLANSGDPDAMNQLAGMLGFEVEGEESAPDPYAEQAPPAMTADDYRAIAREEAQALRDADVQARQEADSIKAVTDEAKTLGYDAESADYIQLLFFANQIDPSTIGNQSLLQAADARVKAYRQEQWDAFEAGKVAQAGGSPIAPSGNGASPSIATIPKTWEEARDSLHERLSNT